MSEQGSNFLQGGISGGNLGGAAFLPPNASEGCCWIVLATTDCSTSRANVAASANADSCCWIVLATTGCSTSATSGAQGGGGATAQVGAADANSCCWIVLATTDCSTSAMSARAPSNVPASCCWIILATTGCTT